MKTIEVRHLQPGMILTNTGDEIMTTPVSLVKTPKNKVEFIVKTKKGHMISKVWNKYTLIHVNN